MIYQWLSLEVSIFYALKELLCMFSIRISSSNIFNNWYQSKGDMHNKFLCDMLLY